MKKETWLRSLYALIGVAILGLGAALLRVGGVGLDPYTAANIGVGELLGLSLGIYQLMINIAVLILIFIFGRRHIGIGTVINMVLTGFFIDFYTKVFDTFQVGPNNWIQQGIFLVIGILFFTFGASFYMSAKLGSAPYDAIAPTIVDQTKANYRVVRVIQDVAFALLGLFTGGPIGIGTFISAFLVGPLIKFWDDYISQPFIERTIKKAIFK
ncbi:YczE/YyaS/YitT family protein [Enterococcus sp. DIV0876]|uniref:YczE/YyaS/YitT family protein n=1 Tax=Enterococcus sp. DIV0876 TaxID=2774633 RepID=UPI003D2FF71A